MADRSTRSVKSGPWCEFLSLTAGGVDLNFSILVGWLAATKLLAQRSALLTLVPAKTGVCPMMPGIHNCMCSRLTAFLVL